MDIEKTVARTGLGLLLPVVVFGPLSPKMRWRGGQDVLGLLALGVALLGFGAAMPSRAQGTAAKTGFDTIRLYSDGAGPSHLFRLSRNAGGAGDVVGIVDPLLSAIRFYDIEDVVGSAKPLRERISSLGVCAMPVSFRPWRIHALRDAVVIESTPQPGAAGFQVKIANLRSRSLTLSRRLVVDDASGALAAAGRLVDTQQWNPAQAIPCGSLSDEQSVYTGAPEHAVRGAKHPSRTIILSNADNALAPARAIIVRAADETKNRMISARELEPAAGLRFVLTAEATPSIDGINTVAQRIIAYDDTTGAPMRELRFDTGAIKGKLGLKPLAILSTGEVLVMGKRPAEGAGKAVFRVFSCGLLTTPQAQMPAVCATDQDDIAARSNADLAPVAQSAPPDQEFDPGAMPPKSGLTARKIFANVDQLATPEFVVPADELPEACRVISGCATVGQSTHFVAIRGVRLTRGTFRRTGIPYAQTDGVTEWERLKVLGPSQLGAALARVETSVAKDLPGNIADDFTGDLGIDCSGIVQIAWNGIASKHRLSTEALKNFQSDLVCKKHLPAADYLEPGDALNLNSSEVHHVMLFAAAFQLDGANDDWLMLESSSSCDGVCWSVYDPAFFDGWSLFRAAGRSDYPCPEKMRRSKSRGGSR